MIRKKIGITISIVGILIITISTAKAHIKHPLTRHRVDIIIISE